MGGAPATPGLLVSFLFPFYCSIQGIYFLKHILVKQKQKNNIWYPYVKLIFFNRNKEIAFETETEITSFLILCFAKILF